MEDEPIRANLEQFSIRHDELATQERLIALQIEQMLKLPDPIEVLFELGIATGSNATDLNWAKALIDAMQTQEITPELAMRIWDLKDEASRNRKEIF